MKGLKYKILWVDDNIETFIELGIDQDFEAFLRHLGFEPEISKHENAESALEHLRENSKYDLILSDLNLEGGESGSSLIEKIRKGEIYTEILFYSAKPDFKNIAMQLYADRVSFLSLVEDEGYRLFTERVKKLIQLTITKLQELSNLRGIVMAETSELDVIIEDILVEIMSKGDQISIDLKKYLITKIEENNNQRASSSEKLQSLSGAELIKNRMLVDANKKSRTLNEYLKKIGISTDANFKNFHENYEKEVLLVRNDLAHAKSDIIDDIECLIVSRKTGEQPIKIDQEMCIKIRKDLRKYSDLLSNIREKVVTT